ECSLGLRAYDPGDLVHAQALEGELLDPVEQHPVHSAEHRGSGSHLDLCSVTTACLGQRLRQRLLALIVQATELSGQGRTLRDHPGKVWAREAQDRILGLDRSAEGAP